MTHSQRFVSDIQYYSTAVYPCSYMEGRLARSQVAAPSEAIDAAKYDVLIQAGFRRSGSFVYRPQCDNCKACLSIRLPVSDFKPNRSQKRAWAKHQTLTCTVMKPTFLPDHYALYKRYQKSRHPGGGMDIDDEAQYTDFLVRSNVRSWMVEFRETVPGQSATELKMVSIIDQLKDGLSAVYTFYSPEPGQNYGTFNVLWQIQQARSLGLNYLYLGYWIEGCQKMNYKSCFKPYELMQNGLWLPAHPEIS
ncbi:arginyltransferase [Rhodoferax fermentans]|uniref:Aspartate/glutamate leucyltransferase n=1 Tax=Rhodoferax fermentans TaxID=28066 RepID=A0A1T1AUW0_RHOFE|nr:arginyltransferase [Rhodoferax fermentans]MBK1683737.1 arginyltransferase [Rhodoferax fermentans]OOV07894.1 arginyltransferase [Rhodoferax fermentans]